MPGIRYLSNGRDLKLESDSCPGRLPQFEVAESNYFACAYHNTLGPRKKIDGSPASIYSFLLNFIDGSWI